jgi:energy-coupling factor transporter transmembrane protein EcfT
MENLTFKYDTMHIGTDQYEIRCFKRKPFFKVMFDIFVTKTSFALCVIPFFMLLMYLANIPLRISYIMPFIVPFFFFVIMTYHEQHKNVNIAIDDVQKMHITENGKILKILYSTAGRQRIKIVDMPDKESEYQYLITQMNERHLFISKNIQNMPREV